MIKAVILAEWGGEGAEMIDKYYQCLYHNKVQFTRDYTG